MTGALANIPFPFGIDDDGNYGYKKAGADTVTPFSVGILSGNLSFASVSRATSLKLTGVKTNTLVIAILNTGKAHQPLASSITFGTDQVQHIRTNQVIGAFGGIIYGKNLVVTADSLSSTINISATYDSSDSGNVSSLSALYVAET